MKIIKITTLLILALLGGFFAFKKHEDNVIAKGTFSKLELPAEKAVSHIQQQRAFRYQDEQLWNEEWIGLQSSGTVGQLLLKQKEWFDQKIDTLPNERLIDFIDFSILNASDSLLPIIMYNLALRLNNAPAIMDEYIASRKPVTANKCFYFALGATVALAHDQDVILKINSLGNSEIGAAFLAEGAAKTKSAVNAKFSLELLEKYCKNGIAQTTLNDIGENAINAVDSKEFISNIMNSNLGSESKNMLTSGYFRGLSNKSIEEAISAMQVFENEDSEIKAVAINMISTNWFQKNPLDFSTWVKNQQPGSGKDEAIKVLATNLTKRSPEEASLWVKEISNPVLRKAMSDVVLEKWMQIDKSSASKWMSDL
jgi:hypothetical protein